MKEHNFEKELPNGYNQALYLNAKNAKFGIIMNLIALAIAGIVFAVGILPIIFSENSYFPDAYTEGEAFLAHLFIACIVLIVEMLLYMILHELTHGVAYKSLTGERLTFGLTWSCAFCGVPKIFVYRKPALIACVAPLVLFTVLLIPLTVALYFTHSIFYFVALLVLGLHLGGCAGDIYLTLLLLLKYKSPKTLVRDTGPEQFIYVPEEIADKEVKNDESK